MFDTLFTAFAPLITEILVTIMTVVFGFVTITVRRYLGVQAEKIMRDALHQAIETGLKQASLVDGLEANAAQSAIEYARKSVPDAIKGLGATDNVLINIAKAKFADLRKRGF